MGDMISTDQSEARIVGHVMFLANQKPGQRSGHNSQTKLLIIPNELREETECLKNSNNTHLQWLRAFV